MNIRKIIKEEVDEFEWAKQISVPDVYAVYYSTGHHTAIDLEGYFTKDAFERYLNERNQDREHEGEELEAMDEFVFKKININWLITGIDFLKYPALVSFLIWIIVAL